MSPEYRRDIEVCAMLAIPRLTRGGALSRRELAAWLGVSREDARDALDRLTVAGVEIPPPARAGRPTCEAEVSAAIDAIEARGERPSIMAVAVEADVSDRTAASYLRRRRRMGEGMARQGRD